MVSTVPTSGSLTPDFLALSLIYGHYTKRQKSYA